MLYAFLVSADPGGCSPEALAERYLDRKLNAAAEQQAEATLTLAESAAARSGATGSDARFMSRSICPLAPVLARMEETGIRVDTDVLAELSSRLADRDRRHRGASLYGKPVILLISILRNSWAKCCSRR